MATAAGCIRVNGKPVKVSYKVKPGDVIDILLPHPPPPELAPENIPINISYEDEEIIILNKNPGMVVHPGVGNFTGTMLHALLYHVNKDILDQPKEDWNYVKLCHRIDKETSGIMVIPKTEFSGTFMARQFFDRTIDRLYTALVWGDIKEDTGTIEGHVGRHKQHRKQFVVYPDGSVGKRAVTHYRVLERFGFATLVECKLETGRTHQIRVHMKYIGHTLFSDWFYGGDKMLVKPNLPKYEAFIHRVMQVLPRQGLHARTLGFIHPGTKKRVDFSSDLPSDMADAIELMRKYRETYS
ncbi:UNVERIFIED_CONTAM: hypothetical protein GTU68_003495 [Idotea baltica]|nr:hypothetical protein [Idotea baltica]